jgi:hypothetical protein
MRSTRRGALICLAACLLILPLAAAADAGQLRPMPINPADPGVTIGPPVVIESQPGLGGPVSAIESARVLIDVRSGPVAKTGAGGGTISVPLGQGLIEGVVRFPGSVDGRASSVTVQQRGGEGAWQAERRDSPSPDSIAFVLRGTGPADLVVHVQTPAGGPGVQFGLRVTPTTVLTVADAGQTVILRQGERFSLELAEGYLWNVIIADDTIVGPVDDGSVYEALQPGSTSVLVSGDPGCHRLRTRCLIPSLSFEVELVVV